MSLYSIYTNDAALHERDITSEERACERARLASLLTTKTVYVVRQTGNGTLDESIANYNMGVRRNARTNETLRAAYIENVTDTLARFLTDNAYDDARLAVLTFATLAEIAREEFALSDDAVHEVVLLLCERNVLRALRDRYEVVTDDAASATAETYEAREVARFLRTRDEERAQQDARIAANEDIFCYAIYPDVDDDAEIDYIAQDPAGCIADAIYSLDAAREVARAVSACVECCVYVVTQTEDYEESAIYYRTREVNSETAQHIREERARYRETHERDSDEATTDDAQSQRAMQETLRAIVCTALADDAHASRASLNEMRDAQRYASLFVHIVSLALRDSARFAAMSDEERACEVAYAYEETIRDATRSELQSIDDAMRQNAI